MRASRARVARCLAWIVCSSTRRVGWPHGPLQEHPHRFAVGVLNGQRGRSHYQRTVRALPQRPRARRDEGARLRASCQYQEGERRGRPASRPLARLVRVRPDQARLRDLRLDVPFLARRVTAMTCGSGRRLPRRVGCSWSDPFGQPTRRAGEHAVEARLQATRARKAVGRHAARKCGVDLHARERPGARVTGASRPGSRKEYPVRFCGVAPASRRQAGGGCWNRPRPTSYASIVRVAGAASGTPCAGAA
jgi:hypothetical protein